MTAETIHNPDGHAAYDLRSLLRWVGGTFQSGATSALDDRPEPENPAELLEHHPRDLSDDTPIAVYGFVDGIQSSIRLTYREHRPVLLQHVAAGCLGADGHLVASRARLTVVCASQELDWILAANAGIPVEVVDSEHPYEIERTAHETLAGKRENLERDVVTEIITLMNTQNAEGVVVVDGQIMGRDLDDRCVGVVKSVEKRYLADETVLYGLPAGWRSPRFIIRGQGRERYSAYVRLFPADHHPWDFGLIRVETFDPELIDSVAAMTLANRQAPGSDGRWDRHITGMANVERHLRARRSPIFEVH